MGLGGVWNRIFRVGDFGVGPGEEKEIGIGSHGLGRGGRFYRSCDGFCAVDISILELSGGADVPSEASPTSAPVARSVSRGSFRLALVAGPD